MTPVETVSRVIWEEREKTFPRFVRQSWEEGTELARAVTMERARVALGFKQTAQGSLPRPF